MKLMIDTLAAPLPGDVVLLHDEDGAIWLGLVRSVGGGDTITCATCDETGQPVGNQDSWTNYVSVVVGIVCGTFDYDTSDGAA